MTKLLNSIKEVILENIEKHGTVLAINKNNIKKNNDIVKSIVGPNVEVSWVLKNNAYELGIENIYPIAKEQGAKYFFVATLSEAIKLREISQDKTDIIAVFHGVLASQLNDFKEYNLIPVLSTLNQVKLWNNYAKEINTKLACYLHVETGMNRLGIEQSEVSEVLNNSNYLDIQYVISHLACADKPTSKAVIDQYNAFLNMIKHFPNSKYSLSASEGVFISDKFHFDLVRVGIYHYGFTALGKVENDVVGLYSSILQVKTLKKGESLGYGHTWVARKETKFAVVPCGYGDGVMRTCSNKGTVFIENYSAPIIGLVSMDMLMIDITDIPIGLQQEGQVVEIIGKNISLKNIINCSKGAAGEVMNTLTIRYPRIIY